MQRINNTQQLQEFIATHCPSVTVRRAIAEPGGSFEHLGGFKPAPGSNNPGFVSRITTRFGTQYYVAVTVRDMDIYNCYLPDHIDWSSYAGGVLHLYRGDMPEKAVEFSDVGRVDNLVEKNKNE